MNIAEGARRMRTAGRWMVFIPLTLSLIFMGVTLVIAYVPGSDRFHEMGMLEFVPVLLPIGLPGAGLWLAGWIVEGFAKDKQDS
jgi:hypothetical protein